jgi:hypothetical protein
LPLFERARVEVYLPDLPRAAYYNLLDELTQEFTYAFGGCTTIRGLDRSYLSEGVNSRNQTIEGSSPTVRRAPAPRLAWDDNHGGVEA